MRSWLLKRFESRYRFKSLSREKERFKASRKDKKINEFNQSNPAFEIWKAGIDWADLSFQSFYNQSKLMPKFGFPPS